MESFHSAFPKLFSLGAPPIVSLIMACVGLGILLYTLLRTNKWSFCFKFLSIEYAIYILLVTLIIRAISNGLTIENRIISIIDCNLIAKYKSAFTDRDPETIYDIMMNIMLFFPLGLFYSLIDFKKNKILKISILGFLLSLTIELFQYLFNLGTCELADVVHNTIGCIIGGIAVYGISEITNLIGGKTYD